MASGAGLGAAGRWMRPSAAAAAARASPVLISLSFLMSRPKRCTEDKTASEELNGGRTRCHIRLSPSTQLLLANSQTSPCLSMAHVRKIKYVAHLASAP